MPHDPQNSPSLTHTDNDRSHHSFIELMARWVLESEQARMEREQPETEQGVSNDNAT